MNSKTFQNLILQLTNRLSTFALVNNEGQLVFSKDLGTDCLTTTRLVAFQIIKKYLKPKPLDLFILNDPENGGFNLTKIIFLSALNENLYLIWDEDLCLIDFKIPPTPLYESGRKNSFVWTALVEGHPQGAFLTYFFEKHKNILDLLTAQTQHIQKLAQIKNQQAWLKASQEAFEYQFSNKALGSAECSWRTPENQMIKLKLSIEERQNVKSITLDFTNTSLATNYSTASHVVESGLMHKLIQFYQVESFFSQAILDKIKIILPPKSIVSKAHPRGEWNNEIQSVCSQLCSHNLIQLNSQTRKSNAVFELTQELKFDVATATSRYPMTFEQKSILLEGLESLTSQNLIHFLECNRSEHLVRITFQIAEHFAGALQIRSKIIPEGKDFTFLVNGQSNFPRNLQIKPFDKIQIVWKLN